MSSLERAVMIAAVAHEGQVDKGGAPYLLHVLRVMLKMETHEERMAAALHDVVEDSRWTLERLRGDGFSEAVLHAVDSLTRRPGEYYESFIRRAAGCPIARRVKRADLEDNSDLSRIPEPSQEDFERLEKYMRALIVLDAHETSRDGG